MKRLAAWPRILTQILKIQSLKMMRLKKKIEWYLAARVFPDDFVPMFDLRHSRTW